MSTILFVILPVGLVILALAVYDWVQTFRVSIAYRFPATVYTILFGAVVLMAGIVVFINSGG